MGKAIAAFAACAACATACRAEEATRTPGAARPDAGRFAEAVRSFLVRNAGDLAGRRVPVKLGRGQAQEMKLLAATGSGVRVDQSGVAMDVSWEKLGDEGLYRLARPFVESAPAEVHEAWLLLGAALGGSGESGFDELVRSLWRKDPAAARRVEAGLAALPSPAGIPKKEESAPAQRQAAPRQPENIVFPPDALDIPAVRQRVRNVRDFGARGDGVTDDTEAFRKALAGVDRPITILIPEGNYLVRDTISWTRWRTLAGTGRHKVTIRLADAAQGYGDPARPKPVIHACIPGPHYGGDSWANAAFENYILGLSVDTGTGNPGAIGILYTTHNLGMIENVLIRSGDGTGVVGLDLRQTEFGPGMIRHLEVVGFDTGIATPGNVSNAVFEHIVLRNQNVVGFDNNHPVTVRDLVSHNRVTAIRHGGHPMSHLVLLDSLLAGGAPNSPAIEARGPLYLRNVRAEGYGGIGAGVAGDRVEEHVRGQTHSPGGTSRLTLRLPIEDPPPEYTDPPSSWAIVAPGQDIQQAMNSGARTVFMAPGEHRIRDTIHVPPTVRRIFSFPGAAVGGPRERFGIDGNAPFMRIEGRTDEPLAIRGVGFGAWPHRVFYLEIASPRPVVIRGPIGGHPGGEVRNAPGSEGGRLHLVESHPDLRIKGDYNVWARQWNPENNPFDPAKAQAMAGRTYLVNDGGKVLILGMKTEAPAIHAVTVNGGQTEILGGFFRDHFGPGDYSWTGEVPGSGGLRVERTCVPYFITRDASINATFIQYAWAHGKARDIQAIEIRGNQRSELRIGPGTFTVGMYSSVLPSVPLLTRMPWTTLAQPTVPAPEMALSCR